MGHDQSHSTHNTKRIPGPGRVLDRVGGTGQPAWRSVEEVADSSEFRDFLEREFPAGASELLDSTRRDFLKYMGAGLALAGAATIPGCRRPDFKIMPYSKDVPEEIIPGKPLYYATSMPLPGGGAEGLLIETHEGRPTKIEGNPLHPNNRGKSSVWAQASILTMYDPDRLKHPVFHDATKGPQTATWADFSIWLEREQLLERLDASEGAGVAFVVEKKSSLTRDFVRDRLLARWQRAQWFAYDPADAEDVQAGSIAAFGAPYREVLSLAEARVIVSLDRDFLNTSCSTEPGAMTNAREFAATRRPMSSNEPMSRLYVVESAFSMTGAQADHRLALPPSRVAAAAVLLGRAIAARLDNRLTGPLKAALAGVTVPDEGAIDPKFIEVAAEDLVEHADRHQGVLVLAGPTLPAPVHAVVHALNTALGAVGRTIGYAPITPQSDEASRSANALRLLAGAIDRETIHTLICLGANPVYDAPGELNFADKFRRLKVTITLSVEASETAAASTWALNAAHWLEAWGDTVSVDGTIAPIQPMIAPLFEPAMSDIEFLAMLARDAGLTEASAGGKSPRPSGYACLRACWRAKGVIAGDFDAGFRRALHDGVVAGSRARVGRAADAGTVLANAARALGSLQLAAAPTQESMDVVFQTGILGAGRFSNNPWMQELPAFGTRVVWDNPVLVSPATAKRMGVMPQPYTRKEPKARVATVAVGGRGVDMPVWILPGMPDNTMIVTLGYGRRGSGLVGDGVGFDANPIRPLSGVLAARGGHLSPTSKRYFVASTQNHWSMQSRTSIVRQVDKPYFDKYAAKPVKFLKDEIYGIHESKLNLAEKLGELAHTPPNISAYDNPYNAGPGDPDPTKIVPDPLGRPRPPVYAQRPQWAMSIDQSTCTGCGACIIACQSENNIPTVGKREVAKGREMHWIRVDRYFTGSDWTNPEEMVHQPVGCVQCENAPCETVCPVNATVHDREGLNVMAYNRCIGTRYCSNNCPYKVRRFNFFDWGQRKVNGSYVGESTFGRPRNVNFIPPSLRQKMDEVTRMQKNPDVTIRGRGVMEKCNYCLQRINEARFETKLQNLPNIPDGFFQTACQQSCPSEAIVFGDMLDPSSRVHAARETHRSYLLLGYLNVRPRTTHMLRVRNPHPALRAAVDPLEGHHGPGHDDDSHNKGHGFIDPRRRDEDGGYALSLPVLGGPIGVHA